VTRWVCGKNGPKCCPTYFWSKLIYHFYRGKTKHRILVYFYNSTNAQSKKNRPICSPC
jgi:hypothetical protein